LDKSFIYLAQTYIKRESSPIGTTYVWMGL